MRLQFITPCTKVTVLDNGIVHKVWFPDKAFTLEDVKKHVKILNSQLRNGRFLFLADIRTTKRISKEVRDYLGANQEIIALTKAGALLVGSNVSRVVANLFFKFNQPAFPTQLFTNEEAAIEWLLEQV
ncbi:MAG: hypothetical protein MK212_20080 [Saprospiraceae bacterium]|nr:hypothetical protein [Saprospiraceae bacterium]